MIEPSSAPLHLLPGWHLFPDTEGRWTLLSPDEGFVRLRLEPDLGARLAATLANGGTGGAGEGREADEEISSLLDRFRQRGIVAPVGEARRRARHRVIILGDTPVASELAHLLRAEGVSGVVRSEARGLPDSADPTDLVVACAGWLPDADWLRLDAWCAHRGVSWHSCYAEGLRFFLGPLSIPGRTAGYADARARRLAAARLPGEWESYWRHLDTGRALPPVPWPNAGGVAAIAGAIAADALAWLAGEPAPSEGHQIAFDPSRWEWRRHPVLPVPRDLMREPLA